MMHFGFREIVVSISAAALIFWCSCEKHSLGEDPEVQKEQAKGGEENAPAPAKADVQEGATSKPTPAEFFPKTSPTP